MAWNDHICKHYFSWSWVMLGKAREAVWPPWALVSKKEVPMDFSRGWWIVTERSEMDGPMGASMLEKSGSLLLTYTESYRPQTSFSTLWHTEGGGKACLRVWNSKKEESGRKERRLTGCSFKIPKEKKVVVGGGPSKLKNTSKIAINNHIP